MANHQSAWVQSMFLGLHPRRQAHPGYLKTSKKPWDVQLSQVRLGQNKLWPKCYLMWSQFSALKPCLDGAKVVAWCTNRKQKRHWDSYPSAAAVLAIRKASMRGGRLSPNQCTVVSVKASPVQPWSSQRAAPVATNLPLHYCKGGDVFDVESVWISG